jgi:hypothetical protein
VMPELLKLAPAADEPWLWSLLAHGATPTALVELCEIVSG